MLFWGLDLLIVEIGSIVVICLDMWAGIKKTYLMAFPKPNTNKTMENLKGHRDEEIDEHTHEKLTFNKTVVK
jgi:hypothetical protein